MTKILQRKSSKKSFSWQLAVAVSKSKYAFLFSVLQKRNCERVVKKKGTGLDDERAVAIIVGKVPLYFRHKRSKCEHADM